MIAAFSARLREQVDLDTLTDELLAWSTRPSSRATRHSGCGRRAVQRHRRDSDDDVLDQR
jgi:hypothetical protein